jgi:ergothioneine biosynthesis protein EgtB
MARLELCRFHALITTEHHVNAQLDLGARISEPHPPVRYETVRQQTIALCAPLQTEDFVVQSMADASPAKWHLAHTTWFFERFVLRESAGRPAPYDARYDYLFNSYYDAVGPRHARAARGLLTRPTIDEIFAYREHVDRQMRELLRSDTLNESLAARIELGIHHEQQHQELLLTDLKHAFWSNPMQPAYRSATEPTAVGASPRHWHRFDGGLHEIGAGPGQFCFDNEQPRHRVYVHPFEIAHRLVTNGEFMEFVQDGGYERPEYWLADGWAVLQSQSWRHPLYWSDSLDSEFTLAGRRPIAAWEPVCHLSYYEADAYARWTGARLPSEAEWEIASLAPGTPGNFVESGQMHPSAAIPGPRLQQMLGSAWEWTSSAYSPYPGFRVSEGALGEYNGKFMANQYVLRGGSCATPASHIRRTYRNFFYPHQRWQFTGLRLAGDV